MSKIALIGASGYLGQRLFKWLLSEVSVNDVVGTYFNNKKNNLEFLDITSPSAVSAFMKIHSPHLILFSAGITDVDKCQLNPDLAFQVNARAISAITAFAGVKIIYYSTDYVFDGKYGNYSETDVANPINIYGKSKLHGEEITLKSRSENLVIRVSGLYGSSGESNDRFAKSCLQKSVLADDDRSSSPILLDDVVSATKLLLCKNQNGLFHVAGPSNFTRYEFQQLLSLYVSKNRKVIPTSTSETTPIALRPINSSLSIKKLSLLGWSPMHLHEALASCSDGINQEYHSPNQPLNRLDFLVCSNKNIQAILIDCVGGLLAERLQHPANSVTAVLDNCCGQCESENQLLEYAEKIGVQKVGMEDIYQKITLKYTLNPDVWHCLQRWRGKYKLILVNNGLSKTFRIWVSRYGLDKIFDLLVNSEEIGIRKPDKRFYEYVLDLLKLDSASCILLDDQEVNIQGAKQCGIDGINMIPVLRPPLLQYTVP